MFRPCVYCRYSTRVIGTKILVYRLFYSLRIHLTKAIKVFNLYSTQTHNQMHGFLFIFTTSRIIIRKNTVDFVYCIPLITLRLNSIITSVYYKCKTLDFFKAQYSFSQRTLSIWKQTYVSHLQFLSYIIII